MLKAFAAAAIIIVTATSAQAATSCMDKYANFWTKLTEQGSAKLPPATALAVNRSAIRALDACESGDTFSVHGFWDKLEQEGNAKFGSPEWWASLTEQGSAKK